MTDFIQSSALNDVLVRSPRSGHLAELLTAKGAGVVPEPDGGLAVTGLTPESISVRARRSEAAPPPTETAHHP